MIFGSLNLFMANMHYWLTNFVFMGYIFGTFFMLFVGKYGVYFSCTCNLIEGCYLVIITLIHCY